MEKTARMWTVALVSAGSVYWGMHELYYKPKRELCFSSSQTIVEDLDRLFDEKKVEMNPKKGFFTKKDILNYNVGRDLIDYVGKECVEDQLYQKGYLILNIDGFSSTHYQFTLKRLPEV